jgi:hypothetical protein
MARARSRSASGESYVNGLRQKLAVMEAEAAALDDEWEAERRGQLLIKAAWPASLSSSSKSPTSTSAAASELRAHLEAVLDADRSGDELLLSITAQHCTRCAVNVVNGAEDGAIAFGQVRAHLRSAE